MIVDIGVPQVDLVDETATTLYFRSAIIVQWNLLGYYKLEALFQLSSEVLMRYV